MLKMPYIHYMDVKSNEQCEQDITGLTSLKFSGTSLFPGLPYNDMFIIRCYTYKGLLFTMSWSGQLYSCSCSRFSGDVVSAMKWRQLSKSPAPSPQTFITSSSLYKQRIQRQKTPERGRWFLTLASPRYEFQASILLKKFLEKKH